MSQNGVSRLAPSASFQDPAVAIDASGRVYFVIANNDTQAAVLTSDDAGVYMAESRKRLRHLRPP